MMMLLVDSETPKFGVPPECGSLLPAVKNFAAEAEGQNEKAALFLKKEKGRKMLKQGEGKKRT